jgi:hypothetical protein
MALPVAFRETLSPSTKGPTFVPSQFIQRGSMLLFEFFKRGCRFIQHAIEFRHLLLRLGSSTF